MTPATWSNLRVTWIMFQGDRSKEVQTWQIRLAGAWLHALEKLRRTGLVDTGENEPKMKQNYP